MPDSLDVVVRAAGAVVWRPAGPGPADVEVALVHRPKYDDWSYPKGKCEPGEHVLRTAVREIAEETGLRISLGRPLPSSEYHAGAGTKQVSYWAARCVGSYGFVPGDEVDQVAWLPAAELGSRLSYQRDAALAAEFRSRPAGTIPFILLRHTSAGHRLADCSDDLARPLDDRGAADAKLLAELLGCYDTCRVVSSPAERCLATVRPYAAAAGVPVQVEPAFAVPVGRAERTARPAGLAAQRAAGLAAEAVPVLICAHRENLPVLLAAVCAALGASPPVSQPLPKGGFIVLQSADGALVSSEQHDMLG
jgi:8-oxo-(d)GTP phosphatase